MKARRSMRARDFMEALHLRARQLGVQPLQRQRSVRDRRHRREGRARTHDGTAKPNQPDTRVVEKNPTPSMATVHPTYAPI